MTPESPPDPLALAGTMVGPYRVLGCASVGGFAAIYRAEHETLHIPVALKVLMPEVVPEGARATLEEYFLREAQILGQLRSEHVLRAHHHGRVACPIDGLERSYIVVDWLDGIELSQDIEERKKRNEPYRLDEAIRLLEPIVSALEAVHEQGLVHRDVNSRNVFLARSRSGDLPHAILIDFGFAKQAERSVSGLRIQASTDTLMAGSPDFAAPEHFDRKRFGEPSPKTDLYTFALTLVHALTLEPPLPGDSPRALYEATLDPEKRPTPNRRGANVSAQVDELFRRALATEPRDRPDRLRDWWNDLVAAAARTDAAPTTEVAAPQRPSPPRPPPPRPPPRDPPRAIVASSPDPPAKDVAAPREPSLVREDAVMMEAPLEPLPAPRRRFVPIVVVLVVVLGAGAVLGAAAFGVVLHPEVECEPGSADCNQLAEDGCEAKLEHDGRNCGACGKACVHADVDAVCRAGRCQVLDCRNEALRDCNGELADGCEIDVTASPLHCGECGSRCGDAGTTKVACTAGSCVTTCRTGHANCDDDASNGCETDLGTDGESCGACGVRCRDQKCVKGLCQPVRVAELAEARFVATAGDEVAVWDEKAGELRIVGSGAEGGVLWKTRASPVALVLTSDLVVWSQEKPAFVHALARKDKARPKRLAGPLPAASDLVVTADRRFVSYLSGAKKLATAPLDLSLLEGEGREVECPEAPTAFGGNADRQLCCAEGKPLSGFTCPDGGCVEKRYSVPCPESLAVDAERAWLAQGPRIVRVELESGEIERWLTRRRPLSRVTVVGGWVYFTEAGRELWRAPVSAKKPAEAAQRLAIAPAGASFVVGDSSAFWLEPRAMDAGAAVTLSRTGLPLAGENAE